MFLTTALLFSFILAIITFILAIRQCICFSSALALALLVLIVTLALLYPYPKAGRQVWPAYAYHPKINIPIMIYALVQLIAFVYLIFYIIIQALKDRRVCIC